MEANQEVDVTHVPVNAEKIFSDDQFVQQQANDTNELTNTTDTNLQHLNEDCLLEIFSVKSLSLMDLCSLADTCTRFQQIIRRVFPKDLEIEINYVEEYEFTSRIYCNRRFHADDDAETILKNFGSIPTEIVIQSFEKWMSGSSFDFVLNLVAKYCVDSLDSLKILDQNSRLEVEISEDTIVKLKPIFKRLQILELSGVDIVDDKTLFADFDSLVELRVRDVKNGAALLENTFPKLERLFYQRYSYLVGDQIATFISRHPKLKTLHLIGNGACCNLQIIGNSCKELEELTIGKGCHKSCSFQPLQALKSLKILKLEFTKFENFKFLSDLPQLRELHLYDCRNPDDFGKFALFTQITKLHIQRMFGLGASDVVEIIKRLTNLEELSVDESLDEQTFSRIVGVVKGRPHVLTLECDFDFNWKNCDEKERVNLLRFSDRDY